VPSWLTVIKSRSHAPKVTPVIYPSADNVVNLVRELREMTATLP
jgi:hypothetical protein